MPVAGRALAWADRIESGGQAYATFSGNRANGENVITLKDKDGNPIEQDNLVVSQVNGKLVILGLKEGTYYLKEVEAPAGYNALTQPVEFKAGEEIRSLWAVMTEAMIRI